MRNRIRIAIIDSEYPYSIDLYGDTRNKLTKVIKTTTYGLQIKMYLCKYWREVWVKVREL